MHIIGPRATDLICEGRFAIGSELTLDELAATIHPHPTVTETMRECALDALGRAVHIPPRRKQQGSPFRNLEQEVNGHENTWISGPWRDGLRQTGNLIDKSGCDIYGYDLVPALRERFAARGGKVLDDAKTLYKTCDIIFMCLPTNAIVQATIKRSETARPGTTIVDMGPTSPYVYPGEPTPRRWRRGFICWTPLSAAARLAPTAAPCHCAAARKRS